MKTGKGIDPTSTPDRNILKRGSRNSAQAQISQEDYKGAENVEIQDHSLKFTRPTTLHSNPTLRLIIRAHSITNQKPEIKIRNEKSGSVKT